MILILSQSSMEPTTEEVMDWLEALGESCVRLNGEDVDGGAALRFRVEDDTADLAFEVGGAELPLSSAEAVWFRRWLHERRAEMASSLLAEPAADTLRLDFELRRHLTLESRKLSDFVFSRLAGLPWLSHPHRASLNKLDTLTRAARAGFLTPATLVTTEREALRRFCAAHGTVITKPAGEVDMFLDGERSHFLFTTALDLAAVDALPERFAPSLFQEKVDKDYELRIFYLAGECHAMAIFSQTDPQTQTDFRHYNRERPNRMVPYRLSPPTEERIHRLMADLGLETGSLDLLQGRDGREVFLEINPVGQFGMVSKPCNYGLEKKVAQLLMRKAADGRRA
ncbi:MAG: grasp-with-spasm system ATP-grasp peptide maturase [Acidobacteria bacterium]|nr:grasp-with-spasm system ATP-grasp peptide maturase [Acidobacteriota bacterium]